MDINVKRMQSFEEKLDHYITACDDRSALFTDERFHCVLQEVKEAQQLRKKGESLSSKQYRRLKRFDIAKIGDTEKLIEHSEKGDSDKTIRYFCKTSHLFDTLETAHIDVGHKRTRVMEAELKRKYCNISRPEIDLYLSVCPECQLKKKVKKRGFVVRPIISDEMNSRCQVDLIDMQSERDGDYRFILNYQDHFIKFTMLRPLRSKTAEEVAYKLLQIFCIFGAPNILQSDNGREFSNRVIQNLTEMWPGLKLVHGKPRHSQSQGSVERSNQDVRDMLISWIADNQTKKWAEGLKFIQSKKNRALHTGIKSSPYEAMFGCAQKIGLGDSSLLKEAYTSINSEEELAEILNIESDEHAENDENILNDQAIENQDNMIEIAVHCIICGKESSKAHKCSVCELYVHSTCAESTEEDEGYGNQVKCNLCCRKERINGVRDKSQLGLTKQAEKMISLSNSKLPPVEIGSSVVVRVADVDRGRVAAQNILAIVLNCNSDGLHQLGTKVGTLERLYARNEFTPADSNFINTQEVPSNRLSLRTASAASSGSKQGFIFCNCRRYCIDKKCKCRSNYVKCNSKCHSNSSCKNK